MDWPLSDGPKCLLGATRSRQLGESYTKRSLKEGAVKALSEIAYRGSRWLLEYTFFSDKPYMAYKVGGQYLI